MKILNDRQIDIPTNRINPDPHQIKHIDSTYSIETILIVVSLIYSIYNLLLSISKMLKKKNFDTKLFFQIVGMVLAILKAVVQLGKIESDDPDDKPLDGDDLK